MSNKIQIDRQVHVGAAVNNNTCMKLKSFYSCKLGLQILLRNTEFIYLFIFTLPSSTTEWFVGRSVQSGVMLSLQKQWSRKTSCDETIIFFCILLLPLLFPLLEKFFKCSFPLLVSQLHS